VRLIALPGRNPETEAWMQALVARLDLSPEEAAVATLFVQQTSEFTGTYAELEDVLGDAALGSLVEVAGDDHVYADVDRLAEIINGWWPGQQRQPIVSDG